MVQYKFYACMVVFTLLYVVRKGKNKGDQSINQ